MSECHMLPLKWMTVQWVKHYHVVQYLCALAGATKSKSLEGETKKKGPKSHEKRDG